MDAGENGDEATPEAFGAFRPGQRAYLEALAGITGDGVAAWVPNRACRVAGISHSQPFYWRNTDPAFVQAEVAAKRMGAERLREKAMERAADGATRYFHTKDGDPLLHPTMCRCGHEDDQHFTDETWPATPEVPERVVEGKRGKPDTVIPAVPARPARPKDVRSAETAACLGAGCGCERFRPAPYTEQIVDNRLLERLLGAALPEEFGEKQRSDAIVEAMRRIDVRNLPPSVLAELSAGVQLEEVLVRMIASGVGVPLLAPGKEILVPPPAEGGGGAVIDGPKPG